MRKVYVLEIIFAIWLLILLLLLFPVTIRAEDSPQQPMIAFTFDDGPNVVQTSRLLDGLAERGAKATFFVVGEQLDYDADKPHIEQNRALVWHAKAMKSATIRIPIAG